MSTKAEIRPAEHDPAWGHPSHTEPRWPASLAVLVALALYVILPDRLTWPVGPLAPLLRWLLPGLELALMVPLTIAAPHRRADEPRWQRYAAVALIAFVNVANVISLILLIKLLLTGGIKNGVELLAASGSIWLTNIIVYALWYWELDRGGPDERSHPQHREPDFLFPQMTTPGCTHKHWTPSFFDYLYVAFTNATAFSPTDTMPLTPWAKMLMMIQSLGSLLTVALVAARAVNILS